MRLLRGGRILGEEELPFTETDAAESHVKCIFVPPPQREVDMLIAAFARGNSMAVEMLLMKGIHPVLSTKEGPEDMAGTILVCRYCERMSARSLLPRNDECPGDDCHD